MKMALRSIYKLFRKTSPIYLGPLFVNCSSQNNEEITKKDKFKLLDVTPFTYTYMIRQSTLKAINNASDILTITYSAIETASNLYRELLEQLINIHKDLLNHDMIDLNEDAIVQIRVDMEDQKELLTYLVSFIQVVYKMVNTTTEICYMREMDNLCLSLNKKVDDIVQNIEKEVYNNQELEKEFNKVHQEYIINSSKKGKI